MYKLILCPYCLFNQKFILYNKEGKYAVLFEQGKYTESGNSLIDYGKSKFNELENKNDYLVLFSNLDIYNSIFMHEDNEKLDKFKQLFPKTNLDDYLDEDKKYKENKLIIMLDIINKNEILYDGPEIEINEYMYLLSGIIFTYKFGNTSFSEDKNEVFNITKITFCQSHGVDNIINNQENTKNENENLENEKDSKIKESNKKFNNENEKEYEKETN